MKKYRVLILLFIVAGSFGLAHAQSLDVGATAELGVLRSLYHTIQIGENGYEFDYVVNGGQKYCCLIPGMSLNCLQAGVMSSDFCINR